MNNTSRHVMAALGWLVGLPLLAVGLLALGAPLHAAALSPVWGIGLAAIFASWALRDAPAHGKSRNFALAFIAAWFVLFVLAVFPYLFATRGMKSGAIATLKCLLSCLALAIMWLALPALFRV